MAYPIESLTPNSTDSDKQAAIQATMQQMMQEGIPQEEAMKRVEELMARLAPTGTRSAAPANRQTLSGFASGGGGVGNGGSEAGYQSQTGLNRRFTNWNPISIPPPGTY